MPLKHGRTTAGIKAAIGANIRTEMHAHPRMPIKQAIAIAMRTARTDARRAGVRAPKGVRR